MAEHLIYSTRPEGRIISNGRLNILVLDENLQDIRANVCEQVARLLYEESPKIDTEAWQSAAEQLCQLAEKIVSPDFEIDIFDYLPLTKSGNFPQNQNPLIAEAKLKFGKQFTTAWRAYPINHRLQLRLVPAFINEMDWIQNNPMDDTMILKIQFFRTTRKQAPIFDENGNPTKVITTRAAYLNDTDIKPGYVYEEKSGTQYLCITNCPLYCDAVYTDSATGQVTSYKRVYAVPDYKNVYIKWTKTLAKALGQDTSFNNIVRVLAGKDKTNDVITRCSIRENPRKFIREVATVFDANTITPETIPGAKHKSPFQNAECQYEYKVG